MSKLVDVATVLSSKKDKTWCCFIYINCRRETCVSSKIVNKKEVTGNDSSTDVIKVTLWANNIKEVPENGKYFYEHVTVRE